MGDARRRGADVGRKRRYVGIHPHLFEQAVNRGLYRKLENARKDVIDAVNGRGALLPEPEENRFLCVFRNSENGRMCTVPVAGGGGAFIAITIWESSECEIKRYKSEKAQLTDR
ncbi:MAG: hypothetical protein ABIA12_02365 [Candidatus Aenigmatarchaeota archaeon]